MLVTWLHVPRGGYGFPVPVDAKILSLSGAEHAVIEVQLRDGTPVKRRVRCVSLRRRTENSSKVGD